MKNYREVKECLVILVSKCEQNLPSSVHFVNKPETNMQIAIPTQLTMTSGLLLNRFSMYVFTIDMQNRTVPKKIDARKGFISLPICCKITH